MWERSCGRDGGAGGEPERERGPGRYREKEFEDNGGSRGDERAPRASPTPHGSLSTALCGLWCSTRVCGTGDRELFLPDQPSAFGNTSSRIVFCLSQIFFFQLSLCRDVVAVARG